MTEHLGQKTWLPDGHGLEDGDLLELVQQAGDTVHLRLSDPDGQRYPRTACSAATALGEWWTGRPAEVNCPACLELVHA